MHWHETVGSGQKRFANLKNKCKIHGYVFGILSTVLTLGTSVYAYSTLQCLGS